MDQIAKAAGVGRATLYRRFPDPPSVAAALLDEHERILQGRLAFGPPPLGPGAPPAERLAAFYAAALEHLERHPTPATGPGHPPGAGPFRPRHLPALAGARAEPAGGRRRRRSRRRRGRAAQPARAGGLPVPAAHPRPASRTDRRDPRTAGPRGTPRPTNRLG
ncbi:TetR/AcrR family transcriptional regulator [Streptomyces lavendulae]|uniref:TetR/AcrR family transcriptional regulator n=1 Tax=Streptomyces lavendulae TaxID=1914 RepID=UPI0036A0A368